MNVQSLRSNADQQNISVEIRIAKAAITVCFLFVASWTPYAVLVSSKKNLNFNFLNFSSRLGIDWSIWG